MVGLELLAAVVMMVGESFAESAPGVEGAAPGTRGGGAAGALSGGGGGGVKIDDEPVTDKSQSEAPRLQCRLKREFEEKPRLFSRFAVEPFFYATLTGRVAGASPQFIAKAGQFKGAVRAEMAGAGAAEADYEIFAAA